MKKHLIIVVVVVGFIACVMLWRSTRGSKNASSAPASHPGQTTSKAMSPRVAKPVSPGQIGRAATSTPEALGNLPPAAPGTLPRRLADITLSAAAEKELDKRESEYYWPAQYRETLDVKLEVFARVAECMDNTVPFGQADVKLSFDPIPGNSKLVVTKAELRGNSLPTYRDYNRAKVCVETGLLGIVEPLHEPELAQHSIMYVDVHFPIDSNPLYELLRSGVEPEVGDLTQAQYDEQH